MMTFEGLGLDRRLVQAPMLWVLRNPHRYRNKLFLFISGTKDLVGLAQTGTGKTAALGCPTASDRFRKKVSAGIGGLPYPRTLHADRK